MKDKSWVIILIMGIALTISITYSVILSQKKNKSESTVTTTSIIEMTATTATIKNTLTGTGTIEYKEIIEEQKKEKTSTPLDSTLNKNVNFENNANVSNLVENQTSDNTKKEDNKKYQITLTIEDKNLNKVQLGQDAEILIKKDNENLNYIGKVINVNKNTNNKSTLNVEILYPDENIKENVTATCTVVIEKAENVVALPVEAIQKNDEGKSYVDVVQYDGTTQSVFIKTGLSDDYYVEIASGLKVGDRVQIVKSSTTVVNPNVTSEN